MGLVKTMERRNLLRNPDRWMLTALGRRSPSSGVEVSEDSALSWTALAAAIRVVSETVATLPFNVHQRQENGKSLERNHPLHELLHDAPNPEQTSVEFLETYVSNIMLWGNGYAEIVRDNRGNIQALWPLNPDRVRVRRTESGRLAYRVSLPSTSPRVNARPDGAAVLLDDEVWHTRGFTTRGLIGLNMVDVWKEAIGLGLITEMYAARFFRNDSTPGGYLKHPQRLDEEVHKRIKESWEDAHRDIENKHRIAILEEDMEFHQTTVDPEKAQFLGLRKFEVAEASRMTRVPPHMLAEMQDATFSNIEQQSLEFVMHTIRPWNVRLEKRANKDLLTPMEREADLFAEINVDGLLRGDSKARSELYRTLSNLGAISPNEIRAKENMNAIDGGDQYFVRRDVVPLDAAESVLTTQPSPRAGPTSEKRAEPTESRAERAERAIQRRRGLIGDFADLFRDAAEQMVRGEVVNLRKVADRVLTEGDPTVFNDFLRDYYFGNEDQLGPQVNEGHPQFARRLFGPLFETYGQQVFREVEEETGEEIPEARRNQFIDEYVGTFAKRYSASSRGQLQELMREAAADRERDPREELEERTDAWLDGTEEGRPRGERVADREVNRMNNAVAMTGIVAAGFLLRWRTFGDACPYCRGLDGRVVGQETPFINEGERFAPEGADSPLTPKFSIRHPPAHRGCDCGVVAEGFV